MTRLLAPRIVAERLGIHRNSVYGLLSSGALLCVTRDNKSRVR